MRPLGTVALALTLIALVGALMIRGNPARAGLQEVGTPEAETETEAEATPEDESPEDIVTLMAWYVIDPSGDFLSLGPIATDADAVAGPGPADAGGVTGEVDIDPEAGEATIILGDSVFESFPIVEDDPSTTFRWLYYNGEDGARPATMVMQIRATEGPYQDYEGTATFISRIGGDNTSGVMVIVIQP